MDWTPHPTRRGLYWTRKKYGDYEWLVEITSDTVGNLIEHTPKKSTRLDKIKDREWAGPIYPPEKP